MKKWIPAACAAALALAAGSALAETKLLFSTFFPPQHPLVKQVLLPWAANVQQATGGSVVVEFSPTSLAPPPGQLDMVSKGIADVTVQFAGVVPNRLTSLLVTEVPGPVSTSEAMSVALWRTHEKFFAKADEHKGVKLLSVFALPPQGFFGTKDEPVANLEQLKSAKIATTPGTAARAYGAVTSGVVAGPAVRYFELVSKGMVDAYVSVTPLDVMGFNLARYTKTAMALPGLGTAGSFSLVMSEARWKKLTPAEQSAIEKVSGEAFARSMAQMDTANKGAIKAMQEAGTKFIDAPPALVQDLTKSFAFVEKEWIGEVGKRGVDGAAAAAFYRAEQKRAGADAVTRPAGIAERASGWLETLGAIALFAMMAITFFDIAGRFVLHRPLPGSTDLVQVLLLLTAGCTLPAVTFRGEHLSIGLFDGARATPLERARRAMVAVVVALTFVALAVLLWSYAGETARNGDVIGYLRLPVAPFVYALSLLCLAAALVGAALVPGALRARQDVARAPGVAATGVAS